MSENMSEDTKKLVGKAMRADQRLKAEDLVANELATAVLSKPLSKIRHSCEALWLLSEEEKRAADISEEEEEEAEKIYRLCQTLQNPFIDKFEDDYGHAIERSATIPWQFMQREAEERLDWLKNTFWKLYGDDEDSVVSEADKLAEDGKNCEALFVVTTNRCTIGTYKRVKNQFVSWAMPKATKLLKKIITVVSSSSFQAAMDRLKGGSSSG